MPPRRLVRPSAEDWGRLGYRVTEMGESGRIIEPIEPTLAARLWELKRALVERIWKRGFPRPDEYAEWYAAYHVAEVQRARLPEVLHCAGCGKPLEDKAGNFLVPDFKMLRSRRPLQRFCSGNPRCRKTKKQQEYRERHPEHKLNTKD